MKSKLIEYKNSTFVLFLFFSSFAFQVTVLRIIWGIQLFSRVFNAVLLILGFVFALHYLTKEKFNKKVFLSYIIPCLLIIIGLSVNIMFNSIKNIKLIGQLGLVIPWFLCMYIPFFIKKRTINYIVLWRYSYYIILLFVVLGLLDYYLIFVLRQLPEISETPYGPFYIGRFSILFPTELGPHFRFYSFFAEPGSLAMMLLPFILYAYLHKKYIGLLIFSLAFFLSFSLGGYIGLVIMIFCFFLIKAKKVNLFIYILSSIILISLSYFTLKNELIEQYGKKGNSAREREESFYDGIANLPKLVFKYPLGMPLAETTEDLEKNQDYTGSNFIPFIYQQYGGVLAFIGYLWILKISITTAIKMLLKKKKMKNEDLIFACTIVVMIPFLLQRTTIWESALFSFLYCPIIINHLNKDE